MLFNSQPVFVRIDSIVKCNGTLNLKTSPLISNLNEYLELFSKCLISIVTQGDLHLLPLTQPIVLGSYTNTMINMSIARPRNCESSILIISPSPNIKSPCSEENISIKNTIQWPLNLIRSKDSFVYRTTYGTRMFYDVLVTLNLDVCIESWIEQVSTSRLSNQGLPNSKHTYPPTTAWELLYFKLKPGIPAQLESTHAIHRVYLLCHHFYKPITRLTPRIIHSSGEFPLTENVLQVKILESNANTDNIQWVVDQTAFRPLITRSRFKYPKTFQERQFKWSGHNLQKLEDERLMFNIFGNATFFLFEENCRKCLSWEKIKFPHISIRKWHPNQHYLFPIHEETLKWVSCGHGQGKLSILELISSYEALVWVAIIITIISCPLIFMEIDRWLLIVRSKSVFERKNKIQDYIFNFLSPLVEQNMKGITVSVDKSLLLRMCIGLYLLMAIILSNGYKGVSIRKLIAPVPPISFNTFEELVLNKYVILSGLMQKRYQPIAKNFMRNLPNFLQKRGVNFNKNGFHNIDIESVYDGVFGLQLVSKISRYVTKGIAKLSKVQKFILNNSRMDLYYPPKYSDHPKWIAVTGLVHLFNCSNNPKVAVVEEKTRILKFQGLHTSNSYKSHRKVYPLSFGKNPLATIVKGIWLSNWVNPKIIVRINAMVSSGIISWQDNFNKSIYRMEGRLVETPTINKFNPSNLSSSIKIVLMIPIVSYIICLFVLMKEVGLS